MKFFSPELRTASVVPRWSVLWTLTRDTVANHSFFVGLYADQIGNLINWQGPRGALLATALWHDLDETITGDLVAPSKREILDTEKAAAYIDRNMRERLPYIVEQTDILRTKNPTAYQEIKLIVKTADRLDALLFLVVEQRLGNSVIAPRIPECRKSLRESWDKLPAERSELDRLWLEVVEPAVEAHRTTGGYGL